MVQTVLSRRTLTDTIMWGGFVAMLLFMTTLPVNGFQVLRPSSSPSFSVFKSDSRRNEFFMAVSTSESTKKVLPPKKKGYDPKWKKIATLADKEGPKDFVEVGLKGTIAVVFKQGNQTKSTMALPNQPLREVAIQAGQYIKYGCGKGECGTCECLVNGQWVRPCSTNVPSFLDNGMTEYVVQVKEVKNKAKSSGKFYSVRSFLWGFYNNVLGMVGFVKYRRAAKQNFNERMEYERLVKEKAAEKKRLKELQEQQQQQQLAKLKP